MSKRDTQTLGYSPESHLAKARPVEVLYTGPHHDPRAVDTPAGTVLVDETFIREHGGYVLVKDASGYKRPYGLDRFRQLYDPLNDDNPTGVFTHDD